MTKSPPKGHADAGSSSVWMADTMVPQFGPLDRDINTQVCIVGAGIAGLSVAYELARVGRSVVVLDDGPIAGGQTQRTTAHLTNAIDDRYYELERIHGEDGARLAADSHTGAITRVETIVVDEDIDCDFTRLDGYLFLAEGDDGEKLDRELKAATKAGIDGIERLKVLPLNGRRRACLRFANQAQFHPLKYLSGLCRAIERDGGQIFTGTHATNISGGTPARVTTLSGHRVTADAVVVATNTPINDRVVIHTKQAPYLTYVIGAIVARDSVPHALAWDTGDPYHYVRLQSGPDGDVLIIGGEDHKTGQAEDQYERYARLQQWAMDMFPEIQAIRYRWSGQVMETVDGLAFIGRNPLDRNNVYVATGDSGMGITHGVIAGMLLTDLILGRENPWASLYSPRRRRLAAAATFARENLNVGRQYSTWLTPGEEKSLNDLEAGSGAVLRRGLQKLAVYRDEQNALHCRSAACPHLGCVVDWNEAEKTWDCPCHGSRFDKFGGVINGPANTGLAEVSSVEEDAA